MLPLVYQVFPKLYKIYQYRLEEKQMQMDYEQSEVLDCRGYVNLIEILSDYDVLYLCFPEDY